MENKIYKKITTKISPLFEEWKQKANWTKEEEFVVYHKLFNPRKPTDVEIQRLMSNEFGQQFLFYHRRKINRIFNSAKEKILKILD